MSPIYDALGVTVGVLQNMQPYEDKQQAYACDVVYGTNSEFGFDYLRDNMATDRSPKRSKRGHLFAIVDEVDNILIDEARTPLIISAPEQAADLYVKFARLAPQLVGGQDVRKGWDPPLQEAVHGRFPDYEVDEKRKTVSITEQGPPRHERLSLTSTTFTASVMAITRQPPDPVAGAPSVYKGDVDYAVIEGEV